MPTDSPSMDIQISSNFERLLFEASGRDAGFVTGAMADLRERGSFAIADATLSPIRERFRARRPCARRWRRNNNLRSTQ